MRKLYIFNNYNDSNIEYLEYLSSNMIATKLTNKIKLDIHVNDPILKGQMINDNDMSYVSGSIKGVKDCQKIDKNVKCLIVKNNYKEQRKRTSKKDLNALIDKYLNKNILDKLKSSKKNIVFSCFSDEVGIFNEQIMIEKFYQDFLVILDYIKTNYEYDNIYVVTKDIDKKSIEKLANVIGNYPDMKFITIPNIYPINNTNYYEENLNIKDYICFDINDLYEIYYLKEHGFKTCEQYITINSDEKKMVVYVKKGSFVKEILDNYNLKYENKNIFLNGLIKQIKIDSIDNLIVTDDLKAIFITDSTGNKPVKCLNCGNCVKYCPARINPKYILEKKKVPDKFKNKCISCGLCNYICPAYIDLVKHIKGCDNDDITQ